MSVALRTIALAAVLALSGTTPALAGTYSVTGTGDPASLPPCETTGADTLSCGSVRAAVGRANLTPGADTVLLPAGAYVLEQAPLTVEENLTLAGAGARVTRISGSGTFLNFHVLAGAVTEFRDVTIADGTAAGGDGANIRNAGTLTLLRVRVTGGAANTGGGVSNAAGTLIVRQSLFDGNEAIFGGGAIASAGGPGQPARLEVYDSTFAGNSASTGGALSSSGNAANLTRVTHSTFSRNDQGAISIPDAQTVEVFGSVFAGNTTGAGQTNCASSRKPTDLGYNVDSGTTCAFSATGSVSVADTQLSPALVDRGGPTDVFSIPVSSAAAGRVAECRSTLDQRGLRRTASALEPCDAGAYEIGDLPSGEPPVVTPTPTPVAPTATPVATPEPTPAFNQTAVVEPVKGRILVRRPGSREFTVLAGTAGLPFGSEVDTRKGTIELTSLSRRGGAPQTARFFDGLFRISQRGDTTELTLTEPLAPCKPGARAAAAKAKKRKLWGDGKGKFRTKGKYAAATVRGTKWLVEDSCAGTLTRVTQGTVAVRDTVRGKTRILRANGRYLARPKR